MENSNRDKQISEMTKDICEIQCNGMKCAVCETGCDCRMQAEALYNAGYRKASEIAEEIFAEIEKICGTNGFHFICTVEKFKELKKKYTESEKKNEI